MDRNPSISSMVSKARLASQERDRIKMPWAHKTFARTDAPREATCSTSEPISQLAWWAIRAWKQSGDSLLYFAHKKSDRKTGGPSEPTAMAPKIKILKPKSTPARAALIVCWFIGFWYYRPIRVYMQKSLKLLQWVPQRLGLMPIGNRKLGIRAMYVAHNWFYRCESTNHRVFGIKRQIMIREGSSDVPFSSTHGIWSTKV